MKKQEKIIEVQNLTQKIKEAKTVVLADNSGLNATQTSNLRAQIKKLGDKLQVVKNSLILRALAEAKLLPKGEDEVLNLEGPTLALFAKADDVASLKALVSFGKTIERLSLKAGFLEGKLLNGQDILTFALLPTKIELQAKLVSLLALPEQRLVYGLNYNLQKLVILLSQIGKKPN